MTLFAGLDLGTSGCRCLIVDESGRPVASAGRPWRYRIEGPGLVDLDPVKAWTALGEVCREALAASGRPQDVAGVGVASQRTGTVLVSSDGRELHAGPNADGRGLAAGVALEREHGEAVYRVSGRLPVMLYLPARLGWFRANRPEILAQTRWALAFSDWAVWRMTGIAATEPTQAAETLVYDVAGGAWSPDLCEKLGVDPALLPDVLSGGTPAGSTTAAAAELGFAAGTPVTAAGADTQAAALAAGVVEAPGGVVVAGSTMICQQVVEEPRMDPKRRLWTSPHPAGGFVVEAHCSEAGAAVDWVAQIMQESAPSLDGLALGAEPGAGGLAFTDATPGAAGDFPLVRTGAISFPAPLLALARPREDVARAVFEGIAFAAASGLEWTESVAGRCPRIAAEGGLARSRTFVRVLATATGRPVSVRGEHGGTALGAAMLAAVGSGVHPGPAAASAAMVRPAEEVPPEPGWAERTAAAFAVWRERAERTEQTALRLGHLIA